VSSHSLPVLYQMLLISTLSTNYKLHFQN